MNFIEIKDVSISFPGVRALKNISFGIEKGEIVALCGENGAGKSTLGKILAGVYSHKAYSGKVLFKGEQIRNNLPIDAEELGISLVHQEIVLLREMTVAENIFLSHMPTRFGVVDYENMAIRAKEVLDEIGLDINPETKVKDLTIAMQQMVEIAKALSRKSELIIFDESTSSLTNKEIKELFRIMEELKRRHVTSIFITHKLDEIFEICDSVTVLKDGALVKANVRIDDVKKDDVIRMMIGRELKDMYPGKPVCSDSSKTIFEIRNWNLLDREKPDHKIVDNFSFKLRQNEILGMYGLVGAGRTELVNSLFEGENKFCSGEILLNGEPIRIKSTSDAVARGISLITEDRKGTGLILKLGVGDNLSTASLKNNSNIFGVMDYYCQKEQNTEMIQKMDIKISGYHQVVGKLSGGNQQKVVIGKWLLTQPKVLILDEPTKGIDVGTKAEVYKMLRKLSEQGIGILVVSSELPEILGISDRIIVVHEGRNVADVSECEATEERLLNTAMGRI